MAHVSTAALILSIEMKGLRETITNLETENAQLRAQLAEIKSDTGVKTRMHDYRQLRPLPPMRLSAEVSENEKLRAELAALRGQLAKIIEVLRKELPSKKWGWSDE
jgi:regulator of replication initiation timing